MAPTLVFFLLLSALLLPGGKGCDLSWIQHRYGILSRETLSYLDRMGGEYSNATVPVPFPSSIYRTALTAPMQERLSFLSEMIHKIKKLFNDNLEAVTWKRAELERFQDALYRQSHELHACMSSGSKNEMLRVYFKKLHKEILKGMNYSSHSWELIRKVVRQHLQRLELLWVSVNMEKMSNKKDTEA
uniref:Interferon a1 n=1 Tax=Scleropages formosus TaxID=113540 RepID=A0A8F8SYR3_SCLFO|nr:interferon a1 [Scleropages formosus]